MAKTFSLIIGAKGGIGAATVDYCLKNRESDFVVGVSRDAHTQTTDTHGESSISGVFKAMEASLEDQSIADCVAGLKTIGLPKEIYFCTGFLHSEDQQPEKRIENFNSALWQETTNVNTLLPMLWLKHLMPLLTKTTDCKISVLSARVGSISDNRLGGWYSYRASKSALNMLLKTAAIEFSRRAKGVKLISFHPGTTDTNLSKPFQKNVPANKLFDPKFVAQRLVSITRQSKLDGELAFLDWDNKPVAW